MVHEKYVKRGNKLCGPYYYRTYRDKDGNVKTEYIGKKDEKNIPEKSSFSIFLLVVLLIISLIGINLVKDYTGYSALDESVLEPTINQDLNETELTINQNLNETTEQNLEINAIGNLKNLYPEYNINQIGNKLEISKQGLNIKLNGASPENIKNLKFNNTLVHIDSMPMESAEVEIEHEPIYGVVSSSKLYQCEDSDFNLETLECSNWALTDIPVETTNAFYKYTVPHFTTYNVGAGQTYETISACLFAVNNTVDDCDLIDANTNYIVNSTFSNGVEFLINNTDSEVIKITNNNITFDGNLTKITGNTTGTFLKMFISGKSTNNVTVKNLQINNYENGIDLNVAGYNISIINNTLTNITANSIGKGGGGSSHLNFTRVENNTIYCNQPGVRFGSEGINMQVFNGNLTIAFNSINNCTIGIRLGSTNSSIYNNTINMSGTQTGIYLCGGTAGCSLSGNNYIWNNNFTNNSAMSTGFYAREDSAPAAPNFFNNSGIGNYWPDIRTLRIFDTDANGYGDAGKQYPYNLSKGASYVSNVTDWAPGNAKSCTTPADELFLNNDTLFCGGRYQINDVDANGLVYINSSNIDVDGYNSTIIGNESGIGINFTGSTAAFNSNPGTNVNITNMNLSKYKFQIYLSNINFTIIRDSYFYFNHTGTSSSIENTVGTNSLNINITILNNTFHYLTDLNNVARQNSRYINTFMTNSTIENNTFDGDLIHIIISGDSNGFISIKGNNFKNTSGNANTGPINLQSSVKSIVTIKNNTFRNNSISVAISTNNSIVRNNTFYGSSTDIGQIETNSANSNTFVYNTFYNSSRGVYIGLVGATNLNSLNIIQNNTFINCTTACIELNYANDSNVYNNDIQTGSIGIRIGVSSKSENNKIYNNTLLNNPAGIRIDSGSNNTFWNNNVTNTTTISYYANVSVAGNYFNLSTGNYWGNIRSLSIFDANGNGLGDSGGDYPYSNTSTNPLVIGYVNDSAPYTTLNDTTNPSVTLTIGSTSLSLSGTTSVSCSGTDSGGMQSVTIEVSGVNSWSGSCGVSSCTGTYTGTLSGISTVTCTAKDLLNNRASTSSTITVTESGGASGGGGGGGTTPAESTTETPATPVTPIEETPVVTEQSPIVQQLTQDLIVNVPPVLIENVIPIITEDRAEIQLDDKAIIDISYIETREGRAKPKIGISFSLYPKTEDKPAKIVKPFKFKNIYLVLSMPLWLLWLILLIKKINDKLNNLLKK